jgi:hypothetical protein
MALLKNILSFLILIFCFNVAVGQTIIQPAFDFDQRFYFTKDWRQNIWGYRGGIVINQKYKVGIGAYYENDKQAFLPNSSLAQSFKCTEVFNLQQKLVMASVYYEPFLYRAELWETSIVSELAYGQVKQAYVFTTNSKLSFENKGKVIPFGIGWSVNLKGPILPKFKPISWIGLNLMAGYRTDILYNSVANTDFNGWYWSLSGAFFLDRISSDIKEYRKNKLKL